MSGGEVSDGRQLWWAADGEFEKAKFDECKVDEEMDGPTFTVADRLSFAFKLQLFPKGGKYDDGYEVLDHVGVGIRLVDGPIDELPGFMVIVKVYKVDGSLELKMAAGLPVTMNSLGFFEAMALPLAADQLAPYVLGQVGVEFVKVRVEFGFPSSAFDALSHLPPPAPRNDAAERMARLCGSGNGFIAIVAGATGDADRKEFIVPKYLLTEMSVVFQRMLNSGMVEAINCRINIGKSCGAVEAFVSFLIGGSVSPTAIDRHALELLDLAERYLLTGLKRLCERGIVVKMQQMTLPVDFLDLLKAAKTYNLRVALNVGLCCLVKVCPELAAADKARLNSAEFAAIRGLFMDLSCQALRVLTRRAL